MYAYEYKTPPKCHTSNQAKAYRLTFCMSDFPRILFYSMYMVNRQFYQTTILSSYYTISIVSTTELPIEPCISHNRINQRFAVQPHTTIANVKLGNEHFSLKRSPCIFCHHLGIERTIYLH